MPELPDITSCLEALAPHTLGRILAGGELPADDALSRPLQEDRLRSLETFEARAAPRLPEAEGE